ncbi:cobalt ECF transporter T component CbiQ [Tepidibacillus sp. LV47]|uniref:cobalt ECF transporter T component CbiQ n=1 Tax=Tepidibacillus sp. LV47 TaxID=3398228 RepID=UPI003AABA193
MLKIDQIAYTNRFIRLDPFIKLIFVFVSFILSFLFHWIGDLMIWVITVTITIGFAKVPWKDYLTLLLGMGLFLGVSLMSIMLSISPSPKMMLGFLSIGPYYIGITKQGIETAGSIFFQSLSNTASLLFLILTTPFHDLIKVMEKLKIPVDLLEIAKLIYRFLFVLLDTAYQMKMAQTSRLGYKNFTRSLYSFSALLSQLFINSLERYRKWAIGLESRGVIESSIVADQAKIEV